MQVNGVKSFKIETVDPATDPSHPAYDPNVKSVETSLDDAFSGISETESSSSSTSALDQYVINDPTASTSEDVNLDVLATYPPSLEEVINDQTIRYLDVVKGRYERVKEDLLTLRDNYLEALPYVSAPEAQMLQRKIDLVNAAILKCELQIDKLINLKGKNAQIHELEQLKFVDLNGDGCIGGNPGDPGTVGVVYDDDGIPHYIDLDTGNVIPSPIMDPDYEAKITEGNNLSIIEATDAIGDPSSDPDHMTQADIYLRLNDITETHGDFDTAIDFGVPEWIWVEKDGNSWDPKVDEETDEMVTDPSLWTADGGLRQVCPEDKSNYMQVRVAEVQVYSEKVATGPDGVDLYNHFIEFLDKDGEKIVRFRIEGYRGTGPASCLVEGLGSYIAASSVAMSFHASDRVSKIIFDASRLESTCIHRIDGLAGKLDVTAPSDERGERAFYENMAAFAGDITTEYYDISGSGSGSEGEWETNTHPYEFGSGHDCYSVDLPGENDTLQSLQYGVAVTGLSGILRGSKNNDIFVIPDVNFESEYAKEHEFPHAEKLKYGDDLYTTVVDGFGGNNIVRAGQGSLIARDVSFAWVEASIKDDVNISVVAEPLRDDNYEPAIGEKEKDSKRDPKNFVWIDGAGTSTLLDDGEQKESRNIAYGLGLQNDYYRLSGRIFVGDTGDIDIDGWERLTRANQGPDRNGFDNAYFEAEELIMGGIQGYDFDDTEFDAPTRWEETFGYAAEEEAKIDEFFNEMFGDVSEMQIEMMEEGF